MRFLILTILGLLAIPSLYCDAQSEDSRKVELFDQANKGIGGESLQSIKAAKKMVTVDMAGDYREEIITVKELIDMSDNSIKTVVFIYTYYGELLYAYFCRYPTDITRRLRVVGKKIYGIERNPLRYLGFANGKFDCCADGYLQIQLLAGEVLFAATGFARTGDEDPIKCGRLWIREYYKKNGAIADKDLPATIEIVGSDAMVTINYNGHTHRIRLENGGCWNAVHVEITAINNSGID